MVAYAYTLVVVGRGTGRRALEEVMYGAKGKTCGFGYFTHGLVN